MTADAPILVLGAGINGAAIARELVLAGQGVLVVDRSDVAAGTTAYSSRLIHGGLRYLEHREFALVRESLSERTRLLRLAPDFVHPLQLYIPVGNRFGGWWPTVGRFLGLEAPLGRPRGLWLVRTGLWLYDLLARDKTLPPHAVHRLGAPRVPPVNRQRYRWLCSYWDAQIQFPERFTLALLKDAQQLAERQGTQFGVLTYHEAALDGRRASIRPLLDFPSAVPIEVDPAAVINATGAWVDQTLALLNVAEKQLIAGTKGSHFFTWSPALRAMLDANGIYAAASDGRPVFLLPLGGGTLVGTTDIPFSGDPATARAQPQELEYLLDVVSEVFPEAFLTTEDIAWHYCGVRPLPYADASIPAAITRRHWLHEHQGTPLPLFSVIGGKLTTCRSLAEEAAQMVLSTINGAPARTSRDRPIPARTGERLAQQPAATRRDPDLVTRLIQDEWARTLSDLVERRLMLLYDQHFARDDLEFLADCLITAGKLRPEDKGAEIGRCENRLRDHFGLAWL